jgi:hypothetical protein
VAQNDNISLDEYLNQRKAYVDDRGRLHKAILPTAEKGLTPASFDKETGETRFVMSAEIEDRDRDIVFQSGLDIKEFLKNPVAPFAHMTRGAFPIGQWKDVEIKTSGRPKRTEGTLVPTLGDPDADRLKIHLAAGSIRTCSIGFMPKAVSRRETPDEHKDDPYFWSGFNIESAELYECSPCMIPANPAALAKAAETYGAVPAEVIAEILDGWVKVSGLLFSKSEFEAEYAKHSVGKTFSFAGRQIKVLENGGAEVATAPAAPENTLLKRLAKVLGLGEDASKDPTSLQDLLVKSAPAEGEQPSPPTSNQEPAPEPVAPVITDEDVKVLEEMEETIMLEAEHALLSEDIKKALAA